MSGLTTKYRTVTDPNLRENKSCSFSILGGYTCTVTGEFESTLGKTYGHWKNSASDSSSYIESTALRSAEDAFNARVRNDPNLYLSNNRVMWGKIEKYPVSIPLSSTLSFTAEVSITPNINSSSHRGIAIEAKPIPLGAWAGLGNHDIYTGVAGRPALEHQVNGTTQTVTDVALSSIKLVNAKTGASVKDFSMVTADAEVTTAGEKITWSHTGGNGFTWLLNDPDAWTAATSNEARKNAAVGNGCQGTAASAFSADSNTVSTSTKTCDGGALQVLALAQQCSRYRQIPQLVSFP